jgi:hypothetical protein
MGVAELDSQADLFDAFASQRCEILQEGKSSLSKHQIEKILSVNDRYSDFSNHMADGEEGHSSWPGIASTPHPFVRIVFLAKVKFFGAHEFGPLGIFAPTRISGGNIVTDKAEVWRYIEFAALRSLKLDFFFDVKGNIEDLPIVLHSDVVCALVEKCKAIYLELQFNGKGKKRRHRAVAANY